MNESGSRVTYPPVGSLRTLLYILQHRIAPDPVNGVETQTRSRILAKNEKRARRGVTSTDPISRR